jgi:phospholipase/carboxylesterase
VYVGKVEGIEHRVVPKDGHTEGRLRSCPAVELSGEASPVGLRRLRLDARARGNHLVYVPGSYRLGHLAPLVVLLHGAGANSRDIMPYLRGLADATVLILLAPTSREYTWEVIVGGYGPDVESIDRALEDTFSRYAVDPERIAVGGFSDGASYALSLGITNGDLFGYILAFSPGFMAPAGQVGSPRIFISHGTHDEVLPIDHCSRRIVPQLQRAGYEVRYQEFEGGHTVPPEIRCEAVDWFTAERD